MSAVDPTGATQHGFGLLTLVQEQEAIKRDHLLLKSDVSHGFAGVNARLDTFTAGMADAKQKADENNAMLHEMRERSSGLDRIWQRLEQGGGDHGRDVKALQLAVAEWKGAVKMLVAVVALVGTLLGIYFTFRFDTIDKNMQRIDNRIDHIPGAPR